MQLSWLLGLPHFKKLSRKALCKREELLKVLNLAGIDVVTVKLQLDRKVAIPSPSNACAGFDDLFGWTFFDLNVIHDEHKDDPGTIIETDFDKSYVTGLEAANPEWQIILKKEVLPK